jgi:hypothetical protein
MVFCNYWTSWATGWTSEPVSLSPHRFTHRSGFLNYAAYMQIFFQNFLNSKIHCKKIHWLFNTWPTCAHFYWLLSFPVNFGSENLSPVIFRIYPTFGMSSFWYPRVWQLSPLWRNRLICRVQLIPAYIDVSTLPKILPHIPKGFLSSATPQPCPRYRPDSNLYSLRFKI